MILRKPVKRPTVDDPVVIADALGSQLNEAKQALKKSHASMAAIESEAKALAMLIGSVHGKRRLMVGKRWAVGVLLTKPAPKINYARLKKLVGDKAFAKLCTLQPSDQRIMDAVSAKSLSLDVLRKCTQPAKASKRFYMIETDKLNKPHNPSAHDTDDTGR